MRTFQWFGDVLKFLQALPKGERTRIGHAIRDFEAGEVPTIAKPLHGLGSGVYELKYHANRVVITLQMADTV